MTALRPVLCMLLLAGSLFGASIKGEKAYRLHEPIVLTAEGIKAGAQALWDLDGAGAFIVEKDGTAYVWAPAGSYRVRLTVIDFESKKVTRDTFAFTVGQVPPGPVPPGPTPPVPPVPPVPPTPPAPIPVEGLRVLIVYESADLAKMPAAQQSVLFSQGVRSWLNSKCAMGADGKTREWRIWDKDVDASAEAKHWSDALKRKRDGLPWVIISDGKTGYEGPLPANTEAMLELLKKYGGA